MILAGLAWVAFLSVSIDLTGDVNDDNRVDLLDFSILQRVFGTEVTSGKAVDINHDGRISLEDYQTFRLTMSGPHDCVPITEQEVFAAADDVLTYAVELGFWEVEYALSCPGPGHLAARVVASLRKPEPADERIFYLVDHTNGVSVLLRLDFAMDPVFFGRSGSFTMNQGEATQLAHAPAATGNECGGYWIDQIPCLAANVIRAADFALCGEAVIEGSVLLEVGVVPGLVWLAVVAGPPCVKAFKSSGASIECPYISSCTPQSAICSPPGSGECWGQGECRPTLGQNVGQSCLSEKPELADSFPRCTSANPQILYTFQCKSAGICDLVPISCAPGRCSGSPGEAHCGDCDGGCPCEGDSDCVRLTNACQEFKCLGGSCLPNSIQRCDDNDPCTTDSCDPVSGCQNNPVDCSSMDNACERFSCSRLNGACERTWRANCDDGDPCTHNYCNPYFGCDNSPVECPAHPSTCAVYVCGGGGGWGWGGWYGNPSPCVERPNGSCYVTCEGDGFLCGSPQSLASSCICDFDPTFDAGCILDGRFIFSQCPASNACQTVRACTGWQDRKTVSDPLNGYCEITATNCDDGDPCTYDGCNPTTGCTHTPVVYDYPLPDICHPATCMGGLPVYTGREPCPDDGNPCTSEICGPYSPNYGYGCHHVQQGCDRFNNACATYRCDGDSCVTDTVTDCSDGNPATRDWCHVVTGCHND